MRKYFSMAAVGVLALSLLAACGGAATLGSSSGGTPTGGGTGGTTTPVYSMGNGSGASFQSGAIGLASTSLSAGGTVSMTVSIVDKTGTLYTGGSVTITFNSQCIAQGTAVVTPSGTTIAGTGANTVVTSSGSASATYTAKGCSGQDSITASATVGTSTVTATGTLTVAAAQIGSIQFISATPTTIGLKGTGLKETSTVVFKVADSTGGARSGATVTFALDSTVGGISLAPTSATSAADGTVQTVVSAGTQHVTVNVTATIASPQFSTQSSQLTVSTGLPTSSAFSIAVGAASGNASGGQACSNVEAYGIDGITVPVTVRLADRYKNPAADNTAVAFAANGGHVAPSCITPSAAGAADGTCTATWTSAQPRPQLTDDNPQLKAAGRAWILATANGEESYTDTNGNGFWDPGEPFVNLGEPYRDDNENGQYDLGEYFLDLNKNGKWDAGDGTFKGITCTASSCTDTPWTISASHIIVMSTSNAAPIVSNPTSLTLTRGQPTPGTFTAASLPFAFNVQDQNGNSMAAGTTVTITADTAVGTISPASNSFIIGCNAGLGGQNFSSSITSGTTAGTGNIMITVTSPASKSVTYGYIRVTVN
jgi:hypothetical protein